MVCIDNESVQKIPPDSESGGILFLHHSFIDFLMTIERKEICNNKCSFI